MEGPQNSGEKCSGWTKGSKIEGEPYKTLVFHPWTPQPEMLRWGLGAETQTPKVSLGERTRFGCVEKS